MDSSCPTKKNALNKMREKFTELAKANPRMSKELKEISDAMADGLKKSGGSKKRASRRNRKRRGGMPPRRAVVEEPVEELAEEDKSMLLTALAHIIAVGTIVGGSSALYCYIAPAIEAYLVANGWIPQLCSNTSSLQWAFRAVISALPTGIESCMAIQTRYNLIVTQIIASTGLTTTVGFYLKRQAILGNYMSYETAIYNVLKYCTDKMRSALKSKAVAKPELNDDEIRAIIDEAIEREIDLEMTPKQKQHLDELRQEVEELEREVAEEEEPKEYGYALSESFGGRKRRTVRKRKTSRRHKSKSRKTRKHKSRRH
uniref:Uncharacterized protein n=1 Tax=viral metagenome TaxID=1070528 RepID=A0A6C0IK10_9ZZZZ